MRTERKGRMRRVIRCLSLPSTCPPDRFVGGNVGLENFTGGLPHSNDSAILSSALLPRNNVSEFRVAFEREEK